MYTTSRLGRAVLLSDWQTFHGDTLLRGLYYEPGLPDDVLRQVTGLDDANLGVVVNHLCALGMICRRQEDNRWQLTPAGVQFVLSTPAFSRPVGAVR